MNIIYGKHFSTDLENIRSLPKIKQRLSILIQELKSVSSISEIRNLRKLQGYENYYRIRLGDYRVGIKIASDQIQIIRFLHRKEIYRQFL